ncbi:YecA family protein [Fusibacter bizertensis]
MKTSDQQQPQEITDILYQYCLEDIKRYSISGKPNQKLSACLSKIKKNTLVERVIILGIAGSEELKKPELVKALLTRYQDPKVITEIVTWTQPEEKSILKELMTGTFLYLPKKELVDAYLAIRFLIATGLANVFEEQEEFVLALQDEMKPMLLALNWKKIDTASAQAFEVIKYCTAATSLYGALPIAKVYEIYTEYGQGEALLPKTKFDKLLFGSLIRSQAYWTDQHHLYADYFSVDDLEELSVLDDLMDPEDLYGHILIDILKSDKPYYRPDLATFLKYADPDYEPENPKLDSLMAFLKKYGTLKAEDWEELRDEILYSIEFGRIQDTLEALDQFGVQFNTRQDLDKFMKFYSDAVNHTRLWVNHGYTPVELRKLAAPSAMASDHSYANASANPLVSPTKKVGRNEPCPCGSGKKYKKCCGAN